MRAAKALFMKEIDPPRRAMLLFLTGVATGNFMTTFTHFAKNTFLKLS